MGIGLLSGNRGEEATPQDLSGGTNEALRIWAAIEHINTHGNLDGFPAPRPERIALISTAIRQGLVSWDNGWYALTRAGKRSVRATRRELRRSSGHIRPHRFSRSTRIALAGAVAAACAGVLWLPAISSKMTRPKPVPAVAAVAPPSAQREPVTALIPAIPAVPTAQAVSDPLGPSQNAILAEAPQPVAQTERTVAPEPKKHAKVQAHRRVQKERHAKPSQAPGYGFGPWGGWGGFGGRTFGYAGQNSSWRYR
jgi:hypothetical protein